MNKFNSSFFLLMIVMSTTIQTSASNYNLSKSDQEKLQKLIQEHLSPEYTGNRTMRSNSSTSSINSHTTIKSICSKVDQANFAAKFIKAQLQLKTNKKNEKKLIKEFKKNHGELLTILELAQDRYDKSIQELTLQAKKELDDAKKDKEYYRNCARIGAITSFALLNYMLAKDTTIK